MVPSEFMENASLCSSYSVDLYEKILENVFSIETRNITYQTLQMRTMLNYERYSKSNGKVSITQRQVHQSAWN